MDIRKQHKVYKEKTGRSLPRFYVDLLQKRRVPNSREVKKLNEITNIIFGETNPKKGKVSRIYKNLSNRSGVRSYAYNKSLSVSKFIDVKFKKGKNKTYRYTRDSLGSKKNLKELLSFATIGIYLNRTIIKKYYKKYASKKK